MGSLPLHPAIVHLPLGLAVLMPLLTGGFAWALWTGRVRHRAWLVIVALQAVLLGAALIAINSGLAEEERVEDIVGARTLHQHEEYAEQFAWAVGLTFALAVPVVVTGRPRVARGIAAASVVATVVVAGLAVRVGHAGGQLVYTHGAAGAYTPALLIPGGTDTEQMPADPTRDRDDHD